jgi:hypothetical protein
MGRRGALLLVVALLLCPLLLSLAFAPRSEAALIYWDGGCQGRTIGRANLDGTGPNNRFMIVPASADAYTCGVEVDAAHLYFGFQFRQGAGSIGRANLDGTHVNTAFIPGVERPWAVAVDAKHIYWASNYELGRANLDGTGVNHSFITTGCGGGGGGALGVAVDAAHVYWSGCPGRIGRANLNGTGADPTFIQVTEPSQLPKGVAVDASHIYWANTIGAYPDPSTDPEYGIPNGTVGRANLDGSGVNPTFINLPDPSVPGESERTFGVAVDASHIYWTGGGLGRANLNGTGLAPDFIPFQAILGSPLEVAVGSGPSGQKKCKKHKKHKKHKKAAAAKKKKSKCKKKHKKKGKKG